MLKIEHKKDVLLAIEEFKKRKKKAPYKIMRRNAKFNNFGFLFGQVAFSFALGTLKDNWDESDCDHFIAEQNLHEALLDAVSNTKNKLNMTDAKYVVCAQVLRTVWFETYPAIWQWICDNSLFAIQNGYIRSPFGARRLLPELTVDKDNLGADMNHRHLKNLKNIASNSPVQNFESVFMNRAQRMIHNHIKHHNLKSRIFANIHDATAKYLHKSETTELLPVIHQAFSMDYPENNGIPYEGETNLADPEKNEYWGFGSVEIGKTEAMNLSAVNLEEMKADLEKEKDDYVDVDDFEDYDEGDYDYE